MVRSSRPPIATLPAALVMNGFHSRYADRPVSVCHTASTGALMVTWVVMVLLMSAPPVPADQDELAEHVPPRNDSYDQGGPQDHDHLFAGGASEVAVQPQREGHDAQPQELPSDLEEQDGQHL